MDTIITCRYCSNTRSSLQGECPHCGTTLLPEDYEACGECGFDHDYEVQEAMGWHKDNRAPEAKAATEVCPHMMEKAYCAICQGTSVQKVEKVPHQELSAPFDFEAYNSTRKM